MIGLEDRQSLAHDIHTAHKAGARLRLACETAGIDVRTLQRWNAGAGLVSGDGRPHAARPQPAHALSAAERAEVLRVANEPRFADMPPARIVPMLADEGVYLASESTFARVLREHGQTTHRGRAKAPKAGRPPTTHIAGAPREVWCWDMTYLPAEVAGQWFYLYLILDLYSHALRRSVKFFVRHLHLTTTIIPRPPVDNDAAPQHEAVDSPPPGGSVVAHRLPASFAFGLTRRWRGLPQ
jgi:putative transposase